MILNMGGKEEYIGSGQIHFNSQDKRYDAISIVIQPMNSQRISAPRGDVDHPNIGGINSPRMKRK
jgi:hypothetical protein